VLEGITYLSYPRMMPWPMLILEIDRAVERHHIAQALTGILLFRSIWILQYIEGEAAVLSERMGVISADPRHEILWTRRQPISARALPRLAMGYIDVVREPNFLGDNDLDQIGGWSEDAAERLRAIMIAAAKAKYPKATQ
jgi:Sensors of blue-light using FAD